MEHPNAKTSEKRRGPRGDPLPLEWAGDTDPPTGMCRLGVLNCFSVVLFLLILMLEYLSPSTLYFSLLIIGSSSLLVCLSSPCAELVFELLLGVDKFGD